MDLAQALAQQATLAVHLTRMAKTSQEAALLQERNRMAREIHDNLAQGFTGIVVQLEAAKLALSQSPTDAREHIATARVLARESLAEARRSVWDLRPRSLENHSLQEAFARLINQMTSGTPLQAVLEIHGYPSQLTSEIEDQLLRIGQEALTNTLRHSNATSVCFDLTFESNHVSLLIRDNGQGFEQSEIVRGHSLGLLGMQERADRIHGRLTLKSRPGNGTEIDVQVPLPRLIKAIEDVQ